MKVIHISTYINGGAGTAAYRIHEALLKNNINSHFLSLDEPVNSSANSAVQFQKRSYTFSERALKKLTRISGNYVNLGKINYRHHLKHKLDDIKQSLQCEIASLPFSDFDLLAHPLVKSADIIHLHWVAGFLDYPSFFKYNRKPVVWTLHDMNPIKGLYHYEADEKRNAGITTSMDERVTEIKRKAIQKAKMPIAVISPSHWLCKHIEKSKIFYSLTSFQIPYTLDTNVFCIKDTLALKEELKIPGGNTVFLFVSQGVYNFRKGFDLLVEALNKIGDKKISLLVIGYSKKLDVPALHCINLGSVYNNEMLSNYYSLADAFIIPSREDNLPNVMLEALACGTPVISFDIGGISEVIKDDFNGLKAHDSNSESLKETLEKFISNKNNFFAKQIRGFALKHFSQANIAGKYLEVYERLLK